MSKALPKRSENYSEWYNEIVKRADLAENSAVRGCMVIKPYGYAIWEKMQRALDDMFKATGHVNAYFPLFVPKSFLEKEEEHAEGFAKECAVVTHYRLKANPDGKGLVVDPNAKLEEELIVRPTVRSCHLEYVQELDPVVARSAAVDQSVVQHRALGNANTTVSPHDGVSLAGRSHCTRDRARGGGRS
jgi:prolyl-tRNA synthetase